MNIVCVIREQRRWGLNDLLTRLQNAGSTMERAKGSGKGEGGAKILTKRKQRAREAESLRMKKINENKRKEKLLNLILPDTARYEDSSRGTE